MYEAGDGHVHVLAASIRHRSAFVEQFLDKSGFAK
jgi:hypothetical protein